MKRASIIVSSYNYGRFLRVAIDSALNQTYPETEVIVVDDGSRDESPQIIAEYGGRITPLIKANGGQGSVFNEGFKLSRGDVIVFLDSDDMLFSDTIERTMPLFEDGARSEGALEFVDRRRIRGNRKARARPVVRGLSARRRPARRTGRLHVAADERKRVGAPLYRAGFPDSRKRIPNVPRPLPRCARASLRYRQTH